MNINVARELKATRIRTGLKMEDVAKDMGIALETLRKYEKHGNNITVEFLEKILSYYQTSLTIFFTNVCEYKHEIGE